MYICTLLQSKKYKTIKNMTLKDYYKNLKPVGAPKMTFVREVARECGVEETTVRNWIYYGMKPRDEAHIKILERKTGIKKEDLWGN